MQTLMPPSIIIPKSTLDQSKADELRLVLLDAVTLLDKIGAWPKTCGPIEIRILNNGKPQENEKEETTQVIQMVTFNDSEDVGPIFGRKIRRKVSTVASILVSVDLFDSGLAKELLVSGATEQEIAVHFFAHEIHHLTEIERLASGGLTSKMRSSRFASAFRNDVAPDRQDLIRALIKEYPVSNSSRVPPEITAGEDIADEAAADLLALHIFSQALVDWKKFAVRLLLEKFMPIRICREI